MTHSENPVDDLHETAVTDGMVAIDDVSGEELDATQVMKARAEEITYFRSMGVYTNVPVEECWGDTGRGPIATRWIDINKGDRQNPQLQDSVGGHRI